MAGADSVTAIGEWAADQQEDVLAALGDPCALVIALDGKAVRGARSGAGRPRTCSPR
jgi:hypothetical protein